MTNVQKNELLQAIKQEIDLLGSAAKVAKKAKVSDATISQMRNGNWELIKEEMWLKVAQNLGYSFSGWALVETLNYKTIANVLSDAKEASLFMGISHRAGSGKTATLKLFSEQNKSNNVFYIQAREWSRREFLTELCRILGKKLGKGYQSVDKLSALVVNFFKNRIGKKPLLIVDEADKLKPNALRFFIFLFNELEDEMGVVISGTENLQQSFERGVKFNKLGFDELSSRFGRKFIKLIGATYKDVKMICEANGLSDEAKIKEVFAECEPTLINRGGQDFKVVEDLRRLKRVVKRELIIQKRG
ncbi:AAA family ATPase [Ornithobacterium rhinotracheale]|uniref:AAA family ATPase n=1 Tax=Ornithobacterium rhinotracheale TaxID=28251 RepID=UPI001FF4C827|nr:AAA family ATPase [Ornithobacterium rhinotracheale]MCK0199202.1 ATP-binding protein [Ornithobacterium rhinotracheale]MCK0200284.1 ATP-binding protein [Ornithobacterium rhinotracheale]